MAEPKRQPGDFLLDRYFANADSLTREAARAEFRSFVKTLLDVAGRIAEREQMQADSPKIDRRRRIRPVP